jgi:hypothetical protein
VEVDVKSKQVSVEDLTSGRRIEAAVISVGEDLVIAVGGGEGPHVGCVVLGQPNPSRVGGGSRSASCSVLTIPPHKEEFGRVTVVTAGVHEDNLDSEGIAVYLRLGEELADKLVSSLYAGEKL